MQVFECTLYGKRQFQIGAGQIALQLRERRRTDDVGCREGARAHERKRHLCRIESMLTRQRDISAGRRIGGRRVVAREACEARSEEHTSELQSLMRIPYAVFCLKKKTHETSKDNEDIQ